MRQRQGGGVQILVASTSSAVDSSSKVPEPSTHRPQPQPSNALTPEPSYVGSGASSSTIATSKDPASLPLPPKLSKALEVYQQAVLHEQRSELEDALRLYRQAFRLDDNVARVYERLEYHSRLHADSQPKPVRPPREPKGRMLGHAPHKGEDPVAEVLQDLDKLALGKSAAGYGVATGTLAHLVAGWPSDLAFEPEEETEPVHIRVLPDELLVHILQFLDVAALERFAAVNRKARILTLDSTIWRYGLSQCMCVNCHLNKDGLGSVLRLSIFNRR
jgi:F-box protein 9